MRQARIDLSTPIEQALRAALEAIEHGPADVRMTKASTLVSEALAEVGDYIDEQLRGVEMGGERKGNAGWWGVWCSRAGERGFWREHGQEHLQTTSTEAKRTADALNKFASERIDSLGWKYEARPYEVW